MRVLNGYLLAFDLDGTLVDTAPDIVGTLNQILTEENIAPLPYAEARILVGRGALALVKRAFLLAGRELAVSEEAPMLARFLTAYGLRINDESRPYPGLTQALDRLAAMGAIFCVCTNKPQALSELLLDKLGLSSRFITIKGADAVVNKKPDAGHLLACCEAAGISVDKTILIGDSETDFLTARNAGVPSILVSFGYSDPPATSLTPDVLIDHFDQLPDAVLSCLKPLPL
jgi:phosphoglycolate phosphatase